MQADQAVEGLKVTGDKKAAADQIKALYKTFAESDCTMVEVSTAAACSQASNRAIYQASGHTPLLCLCPSYLVP